MTGIDAIEKRDRIILQYMPLVHKMAVRIHERLPVWVDLDDLVNSGTLGLIDAATKFDSSKNVPFASYARHRIRGAILDGLRKQDWISRDLRQLSNQLGTAAENLTASLGREPTEDEVAGKIGVEQKRWRQIVLNLHRGDPRATQYTEIPAGPGDQPDYLCALHQIRALLALAVAALPEKTRKVVKLYYENDLTMKDIAGIIGVNESRVSQIHKAALERLASQLQSRGIASPSALLQ